MKTINIKKDSTLDRLKTLRQEIERIQLQVSREYQYSKNVTTQMQSLNLLAHAYVKVHEARELYDDYTFDLIFS